MVKAVTGAEVGFAGPIGIKADYYIYRSRSMQTKATLVVGANKTRLPYTKC